MKNDRLRLTHNVATEEGPSARRTLKRLRKIESPSWRKSWSNRKKHSSECDPSFRRVYRALRDVSVMTIVLGSLTYCLEGWAISTDVGGKDFVMLNHSVARLMLRDAAKATLNLGADVAHLFATGKSEVVLNEGATVSHLTASGDSIIRILGGTIGFLTLEDKSRAYVRETTVLGGKFIRSGVAISGGAIVYTADARLHIHAEDVALDNGKLTGTWENGRKLSIRMVAREGPRDNADYHIPHALPQQVIIHELAGPSFECTKAAAAVEKTICASDELARLDKRLSILHRQALLYSPSVEAVRTSQRRWLVSERNKCTSPTCLKSVYENRIGELQRLNADMDNNLIVLCEELADPRARRRILEERSSEWKDYWAKRVRQRLEPELKSLRETAKTPEQITKLQSIDERLGKLDVRFVRRLLCEKEAKTGQMNSSRKY